MKTTSDQQEVVETDDGFTLIELVLVIAVIAILSAVAIPTFLSVKKNAHVSATEQVLHHAALIENEYYLTYGSTAPGGGTYTGADSQLTQEDPTINWQSYSAGTEPTGVVSTIPDQSTPLAINLQANAGNGAYYTELLDRGVVFFYVSKDGTFPTDLAPGASLAAAATPGTPGQWWSAWGAAVASA